jgi:uncharacterized protein (TIGR02284 family)
MANSSEQKTVVSALNGLLSTAVNAREGYRTAAKDATDDDLTTFLNRMAQERATMIAELEDLIRTSGGEPDSSSTTAGSAHRGWIDVRSTLGDADTSVLQECLRGEQHAISDYKEALQEKSLASDARDTLENHLRQLQSATDELNQRRPA